MVTGRWNRIRILIRLPCRTLPWKETELDRSLHHGLPNGKREVVRKRAWPLRDLFSSDDGSCPAPSNMSLLAEEYRGLRLPFKAVEEDDRFPEIIETAQSITHTATLRTIIAARIARNSPRHTPKRSSGRRPTAYANDSIPVLAFDGNWNKKLGADALMKMGEAGLLNWSTKSDGGVYCGTVNGFQ